MSAAPSPTGTGPAGTPRTPWVVCVLFVVTIGIYGLYWYFKTFQEIKDYSGEGLPGWLGLLLSVFCGIITIFLLPDEVGRLYERRSPGQHRPISALAGFWNFIPIVGGFIWLVKIQRRLNEFWASPTA